MLACEEERHNEELLLLLVLLLLLLLLLLVLLVLLVLMLGLQVPLLQGIDEFRGDGSCLHAATGELSDTEGCECECDECGECGERPLLRVSARAGVGRGPTETNGSDRSPGCPGR